MSRADVRPTNIVESQSASGSRRRCRIPRSVERAQTSAVSAAQRTSSRCRRTRGKHKSLDRQHGAMGVLRNSDKLQRDGKVDRAAGRIKDGIDNAKEKVTDVVAKAEEALESKES